MRTITVGCKVESRRDESNRRRQLARALRAGGIREDQELKKIFKKLDENGAVEVKMSSEQSAQEVTRRFSNKSRKKKDRPWQRFAAKILSGNGNPTIRITRIKSAA